MKIALLGRNFLFRVSGIGMHSSDILENMKKTELQLQYKDIVNRFKETIPNNHPIIKCSEIDSTMRTWVSFRPYRWIEEREIDNELYPKIAVEL